MFLSKINLKTKNRFKIGTLKTNQYQIHKVLLIYWKLCWSRNKNVFKKYTVLRAILLLINKNLYLNERDYLSN